MLMSSSKVADVVEWSKISTYWVYEELEAIGTSSAKAEAVMSRPLRVITSIEFRS